MQESFHSWKFCKHVLQWVVLLNCTSHTKQQPDRLTQLLLLLLLQLWFAVAVGRVYDSSACCLSSSHIPADLLRHTQQ
jgi:hypothetical protein